MGIARSREVGLADWIRRVYGQPNPLPEVTGCNARPAGRCSLCWAGRLPYAKEVRLRQKALEQWLKELELPLSKFLSAGNGRSYRQVSKRRWLAQAKRLVMSEGREKGWSVGGCQLEPAGHASIYQFLAAELVRSPLRHHLNYVIVKGLEELVVLFNLSSRRAERAEMNRLSRRLSEQCPQVKGVWLVQGSKDDEYYLNIRPGDSERLFGVDHLSSHNLDYSPLGFSQVNAQAVPLLLETTRQWLGDASMPMLDLFCGHGLFSLQLGRTGPCLGLDAASISLDWARRNARKLHSSARFKRWDLLREPIPERFFPNQPWVAVVDPPRPGVSREWVEHLAARGPQRVVHWVCDSSRLARQAQAWRKAGYRIAQLIAVDMFAGTDAIEIGLMLEPSQEPRGGTPRRAKTRRPSTKVGAAVPCKSPKKPANSQASSTGSGTRPNRAGRSTTRTRPRGKA